MYERFMHVCERACVNRCAMPSAAPTGSLVHSVHASLFATNVVGVVRSPEQGIHWKLFVTDTTRNSYLRVAEVSQPNDLDDERPWALRPRR